MTETGQLVTVYVTNAIRTSRGVGPGPLKLPPDEAGRLLKDRLAVPGDQAPRGYGDRTDTGLR